ncbi:hypothetical protein GC093_20450 [Paenibacillus sp. LMG 31456]|uniref:Rhamnogalacturonase A/B/Epimerase-like pectate lyase domain-containing protein n=1 Tax=Paenibacillus foliorum TaxID=2654974 RepID=A0A972GXH4_9BACL|nr:glycosyl hydrolase family 28-related protein [Paenibacillus foliorum]NOU95582.1 hypothetical protein [Paenibacillus foliorum]
MLGGFGMKAGRGAGSGYMVDVKRDYGAKGIGSEDDFPAFDKAIRDMDARGGGTVIVPPGSYVLSQALGDTTKYLKHVTVTGIAQRGVHYSFGDGALDPYGNPWIGAAYIRCSNNTSVLTGMWENCLFQHLCMDADMRGSSCIKAHFSKSQLRDCEFVGWSGVGIWMNDGEFTDDLGFLNRIENCNISDTGEEVGVGLQLEYRFIDSWIINNNIEAPGTDIVIKSGGPFRIIGNHLNGNRSPLHNILFDGGVRECLIANNILEGAKDEAIKYVAPGWLGNPERASILVTGNIIRQATQNGGKPIFKFDASSTHPEFFAEGLTITGNTISTDYNPTNAIEINNFKDISLVGNYWRHGHDAALAPVKTINCTGVEVLGNHGDNSIDSGL